MNTKLNKLDSTKNNIIGFYASFDHREQNIDFVRELLWGDDGLTNQLLDLKWKNYGKDLKLILFEIYVNPTAEFKESLQKIGNYRRKEKSIGIPIIIEHGNFFKLSYGEQFLSITRVIINKLELIKTKVKKNKLDHNIHKLIIDVKSKLNYDENAHKKATNIMSDMIPKKGKKQTKQNLIQRLFSKNKPEKT